MIFHMYTYYNKLGGFYGLPFADKTAPEDYSRDFIQGVVGLSVDDLKTLSEDDLFYLGTFDNISGERVNKLEFLIHCDEVVKPLIVKKMEVISDGKQN